MLLFVGVAVIVMSVHPPCLALLPVDRLGVGCGYWVRTFSYGGTAFLITILLGMVGRKVLTEKSVLV